MGTYYALIYSKKCIPGKFILQPFDYTNTLTNFCNFLLNMFIKVKFLIQVFLTRCTNYRWAVEEHWMMVNFVTFSGENNFLSLFRNIRTEGNFPLLSTVRFFKKFLFSLSTDSMVFYTAEKIEVSSAHSFLTRGLLLARLCR